LAGRRAAGGRWPARGMRLRGGGAAKRMMRTRMQRCAGLDSGSTGSDPKGFEAGGTRMRMQR